MKRILFSAAAILIGVACSDEAPPAGNGITPIPDGGSADARSDGSTTPDGDGGEESDGGITDAGSDGDAEPWKPGDSVCNPTMTVGAPAPVASTANDDRLGAVTHDELTVAWLIPSGNAATLQVADRDSTASVFGAAHTPSGTVALDGVTLSPNGLTLVAVAADHKAFVVYQRGDRTESFAPADAGQYANIVAALGASEELGDPVFASGDQLLVYSVYGGGSSDTVRFATRLSSGSSFDPAGIVAAAELRAQGGMRRRPSGVATDLQALFYWDEVSGTQKLGRLQGTGAATFYSVHDLGARRSAQPNGDCSRIYFGAPGVGGADIVSAPVQ